MKLAEAGAKGGPAALCYSILHEPTWSVVWVSVFFFKNGCSSTLSPASFPQLSTPYCHTGALGSALTLGETPSTEPHIIPGSTAPPSTMGLTSVTRVFFSLSPPRSKESCVCGGVLFWKGFGGREIFLKCLMLLCVHVTEVIILMTDGSTLPEDHGPHSRAIGSFRYPGPRSPMELTTETLNLTLTHGSSYSPAPLSLQLGHWGQP